MKFTMEQNSNPETSDSGESLEDSGLESGVKKRTRRRPSLFFMISSVIVVASLAAIVFALLRGPDRPMPAWAVADRFVRHLSLGLAKEPDDGPDGPMGYAQAWDLLAEEKRTETPLPLFIEDFVSVFEREGQIMDSRRVSKRHERVGRHRSRYVLFLGHGRERRADLNRWNLDVVIVLEGPKWTVEQYELSPATDLEVH